jgi:hypothetical protein
VFLPVSSFKLHTIDLKVLKMEKVSFPLPLERGYDLAYQESYRLVSQKLRQISDVKALGLRSGARLENDNILTLEYLGQTVSIRFPDINITAVGPSLTVRDRLVILHYLDTATGSPLTGKPITFKELPEGGVYYPTFVQRAIKPVLMNFEQEPQRLLATAAFYGGVPAETGDVAVMINALPRVPLTLVIWQGDEELPAEGSILFDRSITGYLPTEDITVLCEIIAWRLVKQAKEAAG